MQWVTPRGGEGGTTEVPPGQVVVRTTGAALRALVSRPLSRPDAGPRLVVVGATCWFAAALCWGLFGPVGAGHAAVVASRAIAADNMTRWSIWAPVREYTIGPPVASQYYAHHPWGTFWLNGAAAKLLGAQAFVPRLVAIAQSVAVPPILYKVGRALWGPAEGALAALAYVVLPITLAFGDFPGFEGPLVFATVLTTWGYVRFSERWAHRWLIVSLAGIVWGANIDWEWCLFIGVVLAALFVAHALLPTPWFGKVRMTALMRFWVGAAGITILTGIAYVAYFHHTGHLEDLIHQEGFRSTGRETPVADVLSARRTWIDASFTPLAIAVSKGAAVMLLVRVLVMRRLLEVFPLAMLAMAIGHYLWFKQAADTHTFWPLLFAPYFALSIGVIAHTTRMIVRHALASPSQERVRRLALRAVAGLLGAATLTILPDGIAGLVYARRTGGRFNDNGKLNFQETDKAAALAWMGARMKTDTTVFLHSGMHPTWSQDWALHHRTTSGEGLPAPGGDAQYLVADLGFMGSAEQRKLSTGFHVIAIGPFVYADLGEGWAPADCFGFEEREPTPLEWYFVSGVDPVRRVRPDPWCTWELRAHWGQEPNARPGGSPEGPQELRIAHNAALAAGDVPLAQSYQEALLVTLDTSVSTTFSDGTELLGRRYLAGAQPMLELYFVAGSAAYEEVQFEISARLIDKPRLSLVPMDTKTKQIGRPFALPPRLWKAGFIYLERTEVPHRWGTEQYVGRFTGPDESVPRPPDGRRVVAVLTLP